MHFSYVALALTVIVLTVDGTFIIGTAGTVGVGAASAAVVLAGVAGLALGAGLIGALALRRGKRSVSAQQQTDIVLNMVAVADVYGCALKLVCLIESKSDDELSSEDQLILQLFGRSPAAIAEEEVTTARQAYFYAAYLGTSQGKNACGKIFHSCEASYDQMINYVQTLHA